MGITIDQLFERTNVTSKDVAKKTGMEPGRVDAISRGRWLPSPKERQLIADALEVRADEIDWGHTINPRNVRYHRFGMREDFGEQS